MRKESVSCNEAASNLCNSKIAVVVLSDFPNHFCALSFNGYRHKVDSMTIYFLAKSVTIEF